MPGSYSGLLPVPHRMQTTLPGPERPGEEARRDQNMNTASKAMVVWWFSSGVPPTPPPSLKKTS